MKKARLIYNPSSGKETLVNSLPKILDVYEQAGFETSAFRTTPEPFSAMKEAARASQAGFDLIIAAGGDGTVNEVISGVTVFEPRPRLAILPAGTTNDFARALGIPRNDFVKSAELIHKHQYIAMDIGQVELGDKIKYFMNIGAMGSVTELTYEVSPQMKSIFGYMAYFAKGVEMLPRISPVPVRIDYDDGTYEGAAMLIFVALTNSVGGFEKIAPDKILGDGNFTLIVVKSTNVVEVSRLLRQVLTDGSHINNPDIIYTKTSQVAIESLNNRPLMINLDGEYGGDAPVVFKNIRQHIEFVADFSENRDRISGFTEEDQVRQNFLQSLEEVEEQGGQ